MPSVHVEIVRRHDAPVVFAADLAQQVEAAQASDYLTFTSSSTVRNLVAALDGQIPTEVRVVSIGPVTSDAVREAGLSVDVEAERHDIDGLVAALLADAARVR